MSYIFFNSHKNQLDLFMLDFYRNKFWNMKKSFIRRNTKIALTQFSD